jgi:hypothetical protein
MDTRELAVVVDDARLSRALEISLGDLLPDFTVASGTIENSVGKFVLTTTSSCSLERCQCLAAQGSRVIVLSPMALISEQRDYERVGAFRYLPMSVGTTSAIAEALRETVLTYSERADATALRAAASHESSPRRCS